MFLKSLTTNITINIFAVLLTGMSLTGFLIIILMQNNSAQEELYRGKLLADTIATSISKEGDHFKATSKYILARAFKTSGYSFTKINLVKMKRVEEFGRMPEEYKSLNFPLPSKNVDNKLQIHFSGSTWGLFNLKKQFLTIRTFIMNEDEVIADIVIIQNLDKTYTKLRNTTKIIFFYIIFNTLILGSIGSWIISRMAVRPLLGLLQRAETINSSSENFLFQEKEGNEFSRLSRALNNMFQRIDSDRKTLKDNIISLKKSNIDLVQAQKDIIHAEKFASIGRLSSGIAHEIGNPLGIIGGYLELLKNDDSLSPENSDYIGRAEKELTRIDRIIRQLLDYSRGTSSKGSENIRQFSLHFLLNEIYEMFNDHPLLSGISLVLDLKAEKDIISADYDHIKQVFINLLINAADGINSAQHKNKGMITICSELAFSSSEKHDINKNIINESYIKITYTDNGAGITACDLPNVFDPFFTTKEPGKGTGLGLSVCQTIIENINGTITASSSEGTGTIISILLPVN
jgi:signal transduction histidine kinase